MTHFAAMVGKFMSQEMSRSSGVANDCTPKAWSDNRSDQRRRTDGQSVVVAPIHWVNRVRPARCAPNPSAPPSGHLPISAWPGSGAGFDPKGLSGTAWALSKLGATSSAFFDVMGDAVVQRSAELGRLDWTRTDRLKHWTWSWDHVRCPPDRQDGGPCS